ncbi:type II 3-dehydroquinate dehydratase [Candidatus Aminicenantes bacterium AC-708-M15]|nr:type II 3-dehydroquinate dehydratase [SCandidatus Aminicenantes bacterium Aminicenantia_JdfR_composite]MCP2597095.1 type II 3-dehydroquinate dehydratase [Candidatus Aminicenantes bacterium AC-335-G13]MCP2604479.1 type II 3-dehydroquinate dehydratase [Candidatus Aminicenantes bacterium AC-708-M15]MCP2605688.1 type II 3-dehydroquinate dehydratase [Candidatus Aminicenantes bacterium AC-335-O07]MCP2606335.1 type II 3-dehydroquinate dehydratase [Candidatus Aminicenantes bacterium AC-708-I09]MCP2
MKKKILVINGPNLNLLGKREIEIYGKMSLNDIKGKLEEYAKEKNVEIEFFHSNFEGEIIEKIQHADGRFHGIIINPGGLSYSSFSILDAIRTINIPCVEVHISNIFAREDFRKNSITATGCKGLITGLGWKSYLLALIYLIS